MSPVSATPAVIEAIADRGTGGNRVRILTLAPERPFAYEAGQYAHLHVAGFEPRPYSIASAPAPHGRLNIHIRASAGELPTHLTSTAKTDDIITIEGPFGIMRPDAALHRPVLMVAGGTGIAPMLALASDIIRRGITEEDIILIYGARSDDDVYCRPELDALLATGNVRAHIVTGTDTPDQALKRLGLSLAHHIVYMSGPDPMMLSVRPALLNHLADPDRIFSDVDFEDLDKELP